MSSKKINCFNCNEIIEIDVDKEFNFCPYCGVKNINKDFNDETSKLSVIIKNEFNIIKKALKEKDIRKAMIHLDIILDLEPMNEEAKYVQKQLANIKFSKDDFDTNTKISAPNLFIQDNLSGLLVTTHYYLNSRELVKITDSGQAQFILEKGEYFLEIKAGLYGSKDVRFTIESSKTRIYISTKYDWKKMGFRFLVELNKVD